MKNLDTVFPFYDALTEQYRYRQMVDIQSVPFINCLKTNLIPFCIRRTHNAGVAAQITVWVCPTDGGDAIEIHGDDFGLAIASGTSYDHVYYIGGLLPSALPDNENGYYLDVEDTVANKHWYSETFGVRTSMTDSIYLEFKNDTELGGIPAYWIQALWIDLPMVMPVYIREDEGEKKDGILIKEKQIKLKAKVIRYTIAPDYLTDALMRLDMQDLVQFTVYGDLYSVIQVVVKEPEFLPESYGLYAKIEIQLIYDIEIKKLNFKETGYSGGSDMGGIIKNGNGVSIADDEVFTLVVLFDEPMPDANYKPDAYCITLNPPVSVETPYLSNMTEEGFEITTTVACNVRWSAIRQAI